MKYIIDRFEGNYAVCEDEQGSMHDIPKENIPKGAREGNKIELIGREYVVIDNQDDLIRISEKLKRLLQKNT